MDERIDAYLAGDRKKGAELLLELLPRIRNVVRSLAGRDVEVDDVAQQVVVEVIHGLSGYRGDSPLVGWVDRITVRVALAHARRARSRGRMETGGGGDLDALSVRRNERSASGERYVEKRKAVRLLDALPLVQKSAVFLHHMLGFTIPEVARQEGVPIETIRSRLRTGLASLREMSKPGAVL